MRKFYKLVNVKLRVILTSVLGVRTVLFFFLQKQNDIYSFKSRDYINQYC